MSPIRDGVLPSTLETLTFHPYGMWNGDVTPHTFPSSLRRLEFGILFNRPLTAGILPPNLESLRLGVFASDPTAATLATLKTVASIVPPSCNVTIPPTDTRTSRAALQAIAPCLHPDNLITPVDGLAAACRRQDTTVEHQWMLLGMCSALANLESLLR